jgi:hypothetical protein
VRRLSIVAVLSLVTASCFGDDLRLWTPDDGAVAVDLTAAEGHDDALHADWALKPDERSPTMDDGGAEGELGDGHQNTPHPADDASSIDATSSTDGAKEVIDAPVSPTLDAPAVKLPEGDRCAGDNQCASGICTEGVCCNQACRGTCRSCLAVNTGQRDGACSPVRVGSDPRNECTSTPSESCGHDGTCDGAGACHNWGSESVCSPEACTDGMHVTERRCNGEGQCAAGSVAPCMPYRCDVKQCKARCASEADCIPGSFCANGTCGGKKGLGEGCSANAECGSGSCADGFCCDSACTGKCSSCKLADTGRPNGTCAPIRAGTDSGDDCSASDPSTCGQDGKCDGFGGCRKHPAGTICAPATCGVGNTIGLLSRTCDGLGVCAAADAVPCGHYLCGGSACRTTCSAHSECAAGYYCAPNSCLAKKQPGDACGSADECVQGFCAGGKCCSQSCSCPIPNTENLVQNPGFGTNLGFWDLGEGYTEGETLSWTAEDTNNCPISGAFRIHSPALSGGNLISQCMAVASGHPYNFGLRARLGQPTGSGWYGAIGCRLSWALLDGCNGQLFGRVDLFTPDTWVAGWQSLTAENVSPPADALSALVECSFETGMAPPFDGYLDQIYLTTAPGRY